MRSLILNIYFLFLLPDNMNIYRLVYTVVKITMKLYSTHSSKVSLYCAHIPMILSMIINYHANHIWVFQREKYEKHIKLDNQDRR